MRALFLLLPVLLLAGCNSITRLDSDSFEAGPGGVEAFESDNNACRQAAATRLESLRLLEATSYARNRAYNQAYGGCMAGRGHAGRPYLKNVLPDPDAFALNRAQF